MILQTEEQIKSAYVEGLLTDLEFEALIDKAIRGEQLLFMTGARKADPLYGPDLFTEPDAREKPS